jgi:Fe2+ transport system protein FeoA
MTTRAPTTTTTLDKLELGDVAVVRQLQAAGPERRRFMDLGILPGTRVRAVRRSPLGDPVAYEIRDTLVALRSNQSRHIVVELVEEKRA